MWFFIISSCTYHWGRFQLGERTLQEGQWAASSRQLGVTLKSWNGVLYIVVPRFSVGTILMRYSIVRQIWSVYSQGLNTLGVVLWWVYLSPGTTSASPSTTYQAKRLKGPPNQIYSNLDDSKQFRKIYINGKLNFEVTTKYIPEVSGTSRECKLLDISTTCS